MVWIVKLEERQEGKIVSRRKVFTIDRPTVINSSDDIGLGREDENALLETAPNRAQHCPRFGAVSQLIVIMPYTEALIRWTDADQRDDAMKTNTP